MKLNKIAEEKNIPSWTSQDKYDVLSQVNPERLNRLASIKGDLNDVDITEEMDIVEKCASSKVPYYYNTCWSSESVSQLREYASVSGMKMDNFIGVEVTEKIVVVESNGMTRTASSKTDNIANQLKSAWKDPFNFSKHADTSHMNPKNWEQVVSQDNLGDAPAMDGKSVIPVRGGEKYNEHSTPPVVPGRNSMASPDAIGVLANNGVEDTGARLARERKERESAKVASHKKWEEDKIAAMEHKDIVSKGKVFPTENLVAQSGLNSPSSQMGVYSKFDKKDMPEKTAGEMIKEKNEERRQSIQRDNKIKDWQNPSYQSVAGVSDSFAEALKKNLKKE